VRCSVCWRLWRVETEGARADASCAALYDFEGELCLLEVIEVIRCMLEAVEGGLHLLELMRRVLLWMLEVVEVLEALEVIDVMRCMLEIVEGELCLLEVIDVTRRMLLCMLKAVKDWFSLLAVPVKRHLIHSVYYGFLCIEFSLVW